MRSGSGWVDCGLGLMVAAAASWVVVRPGAAGESQGAAPPLVQRAAMCVDPAAANEIRFEPIRARFVRMVILASHRGQPCVDELEIYGPGGTENLALASRGAKATASSCLAGYAIHRIEHLNDGRYGNSHSWISASDSGWAQIELPEVREVDRVVFSRDREGRYHDRVPAALEIHVSLDGRRWQTVAAVPRTYVVRPEAKVLLPNRPIVVDVPPQEAQLIRVVIRQTNTKTAPCLDELEVYAPGSDENLALASAGAVASASSCIAGYAIHRVEHLNDGRYGNEHSWIAAAPAGWAQVRLARPAVVGRVVFSRDRGGRYRDRLPTQFEIQLSQDGVTFHVVNKTVALTDAPIGSPLPGESPRQWAWRLVAALPAEMQATAEKLAAGVQTAADVEKLLELHRLDRRRRYRLKSLPLQFNPAAIRRAVADLQSTFGDRYCVPEDWQEQLARYERRLPKLLRSLAAADPEAVRQALAEVEEMLAFQRRVLLANPLLDFDELLLLRRRLPAIHRTDTYWQWGQKYGMTVNWSCDFRPKNPPQAAWWDDELVALDMKRLGAKFRSIYKPPAGHMIQHPELHFDADRLLFAMPGPQGAFQVFEIGVDGRGLRQITRDTGPDVDNGDPCYLPDGRILFTSTRLYTGVPCEDGESYVANLCLCDADGNHTRLVCFDQESDWYPTLLNDGRILYTRYEYANVSHQFGRLLFHMNPDGTSQMAYYGSNSYWPNSIFYARPIPNHPSLVIAVVCGHHGPNRTGPLVLFDTARGRRETSGAVQLIPGYGKKVERIVEDYLYGDVWPKFAHPWPLSEKYFLASARLHPDQPEYGVYLVDVFDNITEICRLPGENLFEPIPIQRRPRPPVIPDRVQPQAGEATVVLADVYHGPGLAGVPRGTIRRLRLFTYNYRYRHTLRRGFGHLATPGVDGPWEPRFILGTVPVREDGSAVFRVPANMPISIQPLDAEGRAVQQMRSWFTAMPGEVLACTGCHEPQRSSPPAVTSAVAARPPASIEPWRGPPRGFHFEREVQPVLDKFCVGCHDGRQAGRPDFARKSEEEKQRINTLYHQATESTITTIFTPSFIALHPYVRRPHAESNYGPQVAAEFCADTSPLIQILAKGHYGVRLDREAWERLYTWIDLGAPDHGSWRHSQWHDPQGYYEQRLESLRRFANRRDDVEWVPPAEEAPRFVPPRPEPQPAEVHCAGWPFDAQQAQRRQAAVGLPVELTLKVGEELSLDFVLIPPGRFVMGNPRGADDERPASCVEITQPFYLSRTEVTNAQFRAVVDPGHRSGHVSWRSIDWRGEGYPLDGPDQPAVRVSWHEAVTFCRRLSARTGRRITLPTEAQWEWACRAGSATPLWYGAADADFSACENLAGAEQRDFAFQGKRKWYLRDDRSNDGHLVTAPVASYRPNPWGLYDMAGNVSEWTRSTYRPYPYDPDDGRDDLSAEGEKVVRGGSWFVPPRLATSAYRWKYPPWRKVFNVGFRVVLELPGRSGPEKRLSLRAGRTAWACRCEPKAATPCSTGLTRGK